MRSLALFGCAERKEGNVSGESSDAACPRDFKTQIWEGLGRKSIAVRVGAVPSTVRETLRRLKRAGLSWPLAEDVSDAVLEAALYIYKAAGTKTGHRRIAELD